MHLHVFDEESQVHGEWQVQIPAESGELHAKFVILVSQLIEGDADESHIASP